MLSVVVLAVLLALWFFGLVSGVGGAMIHSLLIIAIAVWAFNRVRERRATVRYIQNQNREVVTLNMSKVAIINPHNDNDLPDINVTQTSRSSGMTTYNNADNCNKSATVSTST